MTSALKVNLWGSTIGAVSLDERRQIAVFQYVPEFAASQIQVAPLMMPLRPAPYAFPELAGSSFRGLPGLLADSLPDKFGNALIDEWRSARGIGDDDFNVLDRLAYVGARGMGALEFQPSEGPRAASRGIDVGALAELAGLALTEREEFVVRLSENPKDADITDILRIGTSAGGARAKAIVASNPSTNEFKSGQIDAGSGFEYWLIKFDGVAGNKDKELSDPKGYGAVEFAYSKMAKAAGIEMSECRLFSEHGRRHFMTKRFDRTAAGQKIHMQSLAALAHLDLQLSSSHSYEQAFAVMSRLGLPSQQREEMFLRMVFNVVARNQDDHVKNTAFLMNRRGEWKLSPAFDVIWAYNPEGDWTAKHQMSINGKFEAFQLADLQACARTASLSKSFAAGAFAQVREAVKRWPSFAADAAVDEVFAARIAATHRLELPE